MTIGYVSFLWNLMWSINFGINDIEARLQILLVSVTENMITCWSFEVYMINDWSWCYMFMLLDITRGITVILFSSSMLFSWKWKWISTEYRCFIVGLEVRLFFYFVCVGRAWNIWKDHYLWNWVPKKWYGQLLW